MAEVIIKKVTTDKELKEFIKCQWNFYREDPYWVPPLIVDRMDLFNKKKNPFFQHAEMDMFLAFKNKEIVGRIAAITNQNHNDFQEDNNGFFGFFESVDDQAVANALFDTVIEWLREKGKDGMMGPMNPSTNDEVGLLIDGFDISPYVMMTHNPPYYKKLYEEYGLAKAKDLIAWYIDTEAVNISDKMIRVAEKGAEKFGVTIRNIKFKNLKKELELIRQVYNNAWAKNWGFVPVTTAEFDHLAANLKQIADEDFLLLAEKGDQPVGFTLTLPNINEVLKTIPDGKLFPTGLFKLLTGLKKVKTVRVITLGIIREYQFAGLGSLLILETIKRAKAKGITGGEMSWILEDNHTMNRPIESLGAYVHKKYRVYHYPVLKKGETHEGF